ncbi:hypothetical protein, partial [Aerococcus sp. UMB8623]|uniref:hypothetical protein n=1 Tax=Aerococcus sp. UMB8623 TaxID=3046348 RepID=UPI00254E7BA9
NLVKGSSIIRSWVHKGKKGVTSAKWNDRLKPLLSSLPPVIPFFDAFVHTLYEVDVRADFWSTFLKNNSYFI